MFTSEHLKDAQIKHGAFDCTMTFQVSSFFSANEKSTISTPELRLKAPEVIFHMQGKQ